MQQLSEKIDIINDKVRQLASKLDALRSDNTNLKAENKKLKSALNAAEARAGRLEMDIAKSTQATTATVGKGGQQNGNAKQMRKEIDRYIKEIDKCIEWLQNS